MPSDHLFKRSGRGSAPTAHAAPSSWEYRRGRGSELARERERAQRLQVRAAQAEQLAAVAAERLRLVAREDARWDAQACVDALRWFYRRRGRSPYMREFKEPGDDRLPSAATVRRRFGTWTAALVAAGLPLNRAAPPLVREWTDEEILAAIRAAAAEGDSTARPFRNRPGGPSLSTIVTRFGSWTIAREQAGLRRPAQRP